MWHLVFGLRLMYVKSNCNPDNVFLKLHYCYIKKLNGLKPLKRGGNYNKSEYRFIHNIHYSYSVYSFVAKPKDQPEQFPDLLVVGVQHTDTADSAA